MLGNYRFSVSELANKYKEIGKPDSAKYWLNWGEERIPFKVNSKNINSVVLYAYNYASVGDDSSAVNLAEKAEEQLLEDLKDDMSRFDDLQQRLSQVDQEMQSARENADMDARQQLQSRVQSLAADRKQLTQNISFAQSHLIIIQRIYFMGGNNQKATNLAEEVSNITNARISIPSTKEANKQRFDQFQLN